MLDIKFCGEIRECCFASIRPMGLFRLVGNPYFIYMKSAYEAKCEAICLNDGSCYDYNWYVVRDNENVVPLVGHLTIEDVDDE